MPATLAFELAAVAAQMPLQVRQLHSEASSKVSGTLWGDSTFARLLAQVFEGELEGIQQVRLGLRQSLALRLHAGHFLQPEDVTALGGGLINSGELHGVKVTVASFSGKGTARKNRTAVTARCGTSFR